jgi:hypothetical protein
VVKINTSNNAQFGVIKGWSTKDSVICTNISTSPIAGCVKWVRVDGLFQCLKRDVSFSEPFIGKGHDNVDLIFKVTGKITIFWEGQELAASNEGSFGIRQSKREG